MKNWLLEAGCPPKLAAKIKIPGTTPSPKQQGDISTLRRRFGSVVQDRERLKKQVEKAKAAHTNAKTEKQEAKAACEDLRTKAKEAKLQHALNVWKMVSDLGQKGLDKDEAIENPSETVLKRIKVRRALLSVGSAQVGKAESYLQNYGDEDYEEPDTLGITVKYKGTIPVIVGADGEAFDFVAHADAEAQASKPVVPAVPSAPVPTAEPEPEPPKTVSTVSAAEKAELVAAIKSAAIKAIASGDHVLSAANDAAYAAGFDPGLDLDASGQLGELTLNALQEIKKNLDQLSLSEVVQLAKKAGEIVQASLSAVGPDGLMVKPTAISNLRKLRAVSATVLGDSYLSLSAAKQVIGDAHKNWLAEPKPFDQHTPEAQAQLKDIAKTAALLHAYVVAGSPSEGDVSSSIQNMGTTAGLGISPAAAATLAYQAVNGHTNIDIDAEPIAVKATILAAAKKAADASESVSDAVKNAGFHLSSSSMLKVLDEVSAKPDEAGFLKAIDDALIALPDTDPIPMTFGDVVATMDASVSGPFIGLMSHYHIKKVKGTPLEAKIVKVAIEAAKAQWSEPKLKKLVFDDWDLQAEHEATVHQVSFVNHAAVWVLNSKEAIKEGGWDEAIEEFANVKTSKDWLHNIWSEWEQTQGKDAAALQKVTDEFAAEIVAGATVHTVLDDSGKPALAYDEETNAKILAFAAQHHGGDANPVIDAVEAALAAKPPNPAVAAVAAETMPTGKSAPKPVTLPANMPAIHNYSKFSKLSKPSHLTAEQTSILAFLAGEAVKAKLPWTKTGKLKKNLGGIAGGISKQFKTAYAAAGIKLTINKKIVQLALALAIDNPPAAPTTDAATDAPAVVPGGVVDLFGMSKPELMQFATGAPMPETKIAPPMGAGWTSTSKDLSDSGGSQGSTKKFLSATMDGKKFTGTGKAPASFLAKLDGYRSAGESAANRTQALLGLGGVGADGYLTTSSGGAAFMQWFPNSPNGRDRYGLGSVQPWMGMVGSGKSNPPEDERRKLTHGLQLAAVGNWLIDDKDDHGGNFTFGPDGQVQGIDHGQTCKFFDSGGTLLSTWDWTTKDIANKDSKASLEANKGWPKRMLKDWASGADLSGGALGIPIMPLTDPAFEEMILHAEGIPDDIYEAAWRPYAEGATARGSRLGRYSHNPADRTVDGFLKGMQARRKNVRAQVAELYSMLASKRALALQAHGDTRPLAEIETEVRDQLGIDDFADGKAKVSAAAAAVASPSADEIAANAAAPGWDESKLPPASHVPDAATIAKWGVKGYDMAIGGDAIKDGRVTFRQLGEVAMVDFRLDNQARAALQARLPGYSGGSSAPVKPSEPSPPTFVPPPKLAFAAKSAADLFDQIIGAGGFTSSAVKPGGRKVTSAEKYIRKWAKGAIHPNKTASAANYIKAALKAARDLKASVDPLEAAAGAHYEGQMLKFGSETGTNGWTFKDQADVPVDEQVIKEYTPSADIKAAQTAAKAAGEQAHTEAVEKAKGEYDKTVQQLKDHHASALVVWQEAYDAWGSGGDAANMLVDAVKFNRPQQPLGVKQASASGKAGGGSTWDGKWGNAWYAGGGSYEIDMTDVVTQLGGVATGEADSRFVIRYNTGRTADIAPSSVAMRKVGLPAFSGKTSIQFPKGSTKEQMTAMMKKAFEVLGIDSRPASAEDHELNYVRKMAWLLGIEGAHGTAAGVGADARWHKVEPPAGSRKERSAFWIDKLEKHLGYDPRHAPELKADGTPKTIPGSHGKVKMKKGPDGGPMPNPAWKPVARHVANRVAHRRVDYTDEAMIHQLTLDDPHVPVQQSSDRLGKILQGTMMSAAERTANGILMSTKGSSGGAATGGKEGSADDDALTGGALSVFLYNRTVSTHHVMGGMGKATTRMIFHPSIHLNTNTYAVPSDSFGSKVSAQHTQARHRTLDEWRQLAEIRQKSKGSAETMAMDQIDIFHNVLFYKLDEPKRTNTIKKLKKSGLLPTNAAGQHLMGMPPRPIEDVIVTEYKKADIKAVLAASAVSKEWSV